MTLIEYKSYKHIDENIRELKRGAKPVLTVVYCNLSFKNINWKTHLQHF